MYDELNLFMLKNDMSVLLITCVSNSVPEMQRTGTEAHRMV
jgi:hypothetical protein